MAFALQPRYMNSYVYISTFQMSIVKMLKTRYGIYDNKNLPISADSYCSFMPTCLKYTKQNKSLTLIQLSCSWNSKGYSSSKTHHNPHTQFVDTRAKIESWTFVCLANIRSQPYRYPVLSVSIHRTYLSVLPIPPIQYRTWIFHTHQQPVDHMPLS